MRNRDGLSLSHPRSVFLSLLPHSRKFVVYTSVRIAPTSSLEDADGRDPLMVRDLGGWLALPQAHRALPVELLPVVLPLEKVLEGLEVLVERAREPSVGASLQSVARLEAEVDSIRAHLAGYSLPFVALRGILPLTTSGEWETEEWLLHEAEDLTLSLWPDEGGAPRRISLALPSQGPWILLLTDEEPDEGGPPVMSRAGPALVELPRGRLRVGTAGEDSRSSSADPPVSLPRGRYLVDFYRLEGSPQASFGPLPDDPQHPDLVIRFRELDQGETAPRVPFPHQLRP